MDENLTPEQTNEFKRQLEDTKKQLEEARQKQMVGQTSPQDKSIEILFEIGARVFLEYTKMSDETQRYTVDKDTEIEKE